MGTAREGVFGGPAAIGLDRKAGTKGLAFTFSPDDLREGGEDCDAGWTAGCCWATGWGAGAETGCDTVCSAGFETGS